MILSGEEHTGNDVADNDNEVKLDAGVKNELMRKLFEDVRQRLQKIFRVTEARYNLRRRDVTFLPNQLFWRRNFVLSDASKYYTTNLHLNT